MQKIVLMSGGFHPFHAGHAALYQSALENFPDALVLVGATDVQTKRPFPFEIKRMLAKLAGVPSENFLQVSRQFSGIDPALAPYIQGQEDQTILIFLRSDKDRNKPPLPPTRDAQGNLPLVTRGSRTGQPVSDYLEYYEGNENNLQPMTKHAYMAYLPVKEFGSNLTSATEIRNRWPSMTDNEKIDLVKNMYPVTQNDKKLQKKTVQLIDLGLQTPIEKTPEVLPPNKKEKKSSVSKNQLESLIESLKQGQFLPSQQIINNYGSIDNIIKLLEHQLNPTIVEINQDYLPEYK